MTTAIDRIEEMRKDQGLSRRVLGRRAGIATTTLSNYRFRGDKIRYEQLQKIAAALGTTPHYLQTGEQPSQAVQDEIETLADMIVAVDSARMDDLFKRVYNLIYEFTKG